MTELVTSAHKTMTSEIATPATSSTAETEHVHRATDWPLQRLYTHTLALIMHASTQGGQLTELHIKNIKNLPIMRYFSSNLGVRETVEYL